MNDAASKTIADAAVSPMIDSAKFIRKIKEEMGNPKSTSGTNPLIRQDEKDREADRDLRKIYAIGLIVILSIQLA